MTSAKPPGTWIVQKSLLPRHSDLQQQSQKKSGEPKEIFVKTTICKFYAQSSCTKGGDCKFAHTADELKPLPDLRCTRPCLLFAKGFCTAGGSCTFAHSKSELRSSVPSGARSKRAERRQSVQSTSSQSTRRSTDVSRTNTLFSVVMEPSATSSEAMASPTAAFCSDDECNRGSGIDLSLLHASIEEEPSISPRNEKLPCRIAAETWCTFIVNSIPLAEAGVNWQKSSSLIGTDGQEIIEMKNSFLETRSERQSASRRWSSLPSRLRQKGNDSDVLRAKSLHFIYLRL